MTNLMYFLDMKKASHIPYPDVLNRVAVQWRGPHRMICLYHNYARNLPRGEFRLTPGIFVLNYILHGTGYFRDSDGQKHPFSAGYIVQFQANDSRRLFISPDEEFIECSFSCDSATFQRLQQATLTEPEVPVFEPGIQGRITEAYFDLFETLLAANDGNLPMRKLAVYLDALYSPLEQPPLNNAFITAACRALSQNLDRKISLEDTARQLGMPYHAFRKTFKSAVGISPGTYRIQQKLDTACFKLISGKTVQQTADELGYIDPFYFSRQFKQNTGLSPLRFKQMYGRPGG